MSSKQRKFYIYVEGGGNDNAPLRRECSNGFSTLLRKLGLEGKMPRIVACGSRRDAYEDFSSALKDKGDDDIFILLVDAEGPVAIKTSPWTHLKNRPGDSWDQPAGATDDDCHLMTQCMETWLLADATAFAAFFGKGFHATSLPSRTGAALEDEAKLDTYAKIQKATAKCDPKAPYGKGAHSFKLLALVDPAKVRQLPWAARFFDHLLKVA